MPRRNKPRPRDRRGNILVLSAFLMIGMIGFLAFAIDLGYLATARAELQKSADAAAMAAAWELIDEASLRGSVSRDASLEDARSMALRFAAQNPVCSVSPLLDPNPSNTAAGDVLIGHMPNPVDPTASMTFADPRLFNVVRVRVNRTAGRNGEIPMFFARALGRDSVASQAEATAAVLSNFGGFRLTNETYNLDLLPFALDEQTWNELLAGGGSDDWSYNSATGELRGGRDGIREVNLYPQGTGSPGNRGTVDIGSSNNSTADISRQILHGVNAADLAHHGGSLVFNQQGVLYLNGDTGISAGVKDELASIRGQPRIIPIFRSVTGPGNNAQYTITQFVGVRIVDVVLTGKMSSKRVIIQPANVVIRGGIPTTGAQKTFFVYSPAVLVR